MRLSLVLFAITAFSIASPLHAEEAKADANPMTDKEKLSYALGLNIGSTMKRDELDMDADKIAEGIADALAEKEPKLSQDEMNAVMMKFQQERQAAMMKKRAEMMAKAKVDGEKNQTEQDTFLAENAKADGVTTTESGLQYKVLRAGTGNQPGKTDKVKVHYKGTVLDGTEFDSSYKRGEPAEFGLNQVVAGWTEGIQLMKPGAKYRFWIPSKLGYGPNGRPGSPIGPNSLLIFDVELLDFTPSGLLSQPEGK